jgi:hypothetical protein
MFIRWWSYQIAQLNFASLFIDWKIFNPKKLLNRNGACKSTPPNFTSSQKKRKDTKKKKKRKDKKQTLYIEFATQNFCQPFI